MITVMIVEDELLVRMGIASSVPWEKLGMKVIGEFADGESAWNFYRLSRPQLVITDIRMPKMDGIELIERIRKESEDCEIIVVTNVTYGEAYTKAKEMGVSTFLLKATLNPDDLEKAAVEYLKKTGEGKGRTKKSNAVQNFLTDFFTSLPGKEEAGLAFWQKTGLPEPQAFLLFRIMENEVINHDFRESLINLVQHHFTNQDTIFRISFREDPMLVFLYAPESEQLIKELKNLKRYVAEHFCAEIRLVLMPDAPFEKLPALAEKAAGLLPDKCFFAEGLAVLDATGRIVDAQKPEVRLAIDYIANHLNEDLSLTRVCRIAGFHPSYFSTLFKQETGIGFSQYVIRARVSEAQRLLRNPSLSMQEISERCGFSDVSWFSHQFRQVTGISPAKWRNGI